MSFRKGNDMRIIAVLIVMFTALTTIPLVNAHVPSDKDIALIRSNDYSLVIDIMTLDNGWLVNTRRYDANTLNQHAFTRFEDVLKYLRKLLIQSSELPSTASETVEP